MNQTSRKKEDADKLLRSVKDKAKNPREIQLKGFHIASLYTQAKEYRTALHHVQDYLAVKPNDVRAHRLLGEVYEAQGDVQRAIQSYRRALELNEMQKDLVLKVAELYCRVGRENYDAERHRYWAERAEKYFPGNAKIYSIMEHICRKTGKLNDLKTYLQQKLRSRPQDLKLHLLLLQVLMELKKVKEAQQLCAQVEGARLFDQELLWWQKTLKLYEMLLTGVDDGDQSPEHIVTFGHMLVSINNLVRIMLNMHNTTVGQAAKLLKVMDKELFRASDYIDASPAGPEQSGAQIVLQEMKAQLYTHLATLLFKMAATGSARWADVVGLITACYLVSAQVPSCPETTKALGNIQNRIYSLAQCRLSEVCHILTSIVKQQKKNSRWLKQCHTNWCSEEGRQQLLSQAFGHGDLDPASSFLMLDDSLVGASFTELPNLINTVFLYDQESIQSEPANLQRLIWLGLQWDVRQDGVLPDLGQFLQPVFSRLLFSTQHLENTSVDNIRLLDIEAFLYCCVHVAKAQQDQLQARGHTFPKALPLGLCRGMCGPRQLEWYSALYCLYTARASSSDRAKLRRTVQSGLEVLRCRMNHGMETSLLVRLGRTFGQRMQEVQQSSTGDDNRDQWTGFQQMSVMYWQAALEHLQLLTRNQAVPTQQKPFFPYGNRPIPADKIQEYQDEGTVAIAQHKFQQGQFQQAVAMLDKTKSANGSYLKAQMYLTKAETEAEGQGLEVNSSPMRRGELLDKAKYALFDTMDSIQNQPDNPLHVEIETSLRKIDDHQAELSREVAILEEEAASAAGDTLLGSLNNSRNLSGLSDTAPLEATGNDPSPRRLASELRSLNLSHNRLMEENTQLRSLAATHSRILEQNQQLIDKQNTLMESNNALMQQVLELNMKFQELTTAQAEKAAATPPPPLPPQPLPENITSNRPIIISAAECKFDNSNLSATQLGGTGYPIITHAGLASPMPGVASPMHGLPATGLYPHPGYGYYAAPHAYGLATAGAYETPGLQPSLITSTPAMHPGRLPNAPQYMMYEDPTSPTEVEVPDVETSVAEVQPTTSFKGGAVSQPTGQADLFKFTARLPQGAPEQETSEPEGSLPAAGKAASKGQDITNSSPLLLSMLMDKQDDLTKQGLSKSGSITAGTPSQSFTSTPSNPAPTTPLFAPKDSTQGFLATGNASQPGFGSGLPQASASPNPTSATTNAMPTLFKASQPASNGFAQPTTFKTSSQSPFEGFSFARPSTSESASAASLFGSGSTGTSNSVGFQGFGKPSETLPKNNVPEDKNSDEDDVIFVWEKRPTPDQRKRAEELLLPPTFFLYEDEPPCPGCAGCDPEDLAAREKTAPKPTQQASALPPSQGLLGSAAPTQHTFGDVAKTAVAKETPTMFGTQEANQPSSIFGGGGASTLSFANITAEKQGTFAGASGKGFSFAQAGAPVFGGVDDAGGADESQEHDPHYDPIMSLPELVEVKTGEEEEEIMYKQRARLYRFAKDLGVWKERGVGDVKLLRHRQSGVLRLIMRREQVLKLCANHRITTDMKLDPLQSSDRAWVWHAIDYSEDEPAHEQLAIKFKTEELAHEFKRRLEELQEARKEEEKAAEQKKEEDAAAEAVEETQEEAVEETQEDGKETEKEEATGGGDEPNKGVVSEDLFAKFKSQAGDWQCDTCMLKNTKDVAACAACMTPKPGASPPTATSGTATSTATFGAAGGFKFGSSNGASKPDFKFGGPSATSSGSSLPTGAVSFGAPTANATMTAAKETTQAASTTFSFGNTFPKFDLGGAGDKAGSPMVATQNPSTAFAFGTKALTPPKAGGSADTTVASTSPAAQVTPIQPSVGFVFGAVKPATSTPTPTTKTKDEPPKPFSFSDIAKSKGGSFSFRLNVNKTPEVSTEKAPVKPKSPGIVKSPGLNKGGDNEYYKDDEGDHIHFEPIVQLPEYIEMTSGEEGETAKFSHRAKLYRFDKETSQWKERGLGDIKLLYNPANRKYRILMRREQVLKVCANHFVTPELDLKSNAGSTKSWVWMAMDASEDEPQIEQLAVRFKTEETALEFKKAVDAAKEDIKKQGKDEIKDVLKAGKDQEKDDGPSTKEISGEVRGDSAGSKMPDEQEKALKDKKAVDAAEEDIKRQGQDEIKEEETQDAPEAGKDQEKDDGPSTKEVSGEVQEDSAGSKTPDEEDVEDDGWEDDDEDEDEEDKEEQDEDGDEQDEDEQDGDENEQDGGEDEQVESKDKEQVEDKDDKEQEQATEGGNSDLPVVKSCDPNISKAFSELLRGTTTSEAQKPKAEEATATSTPEPSGKEEDATGGSKDDSVSEERDDIHFEPVAHLPEEVEKVTGEEDETQLFCSRAKLYRYDKATAQWKDRGLGDIKILHNTKNNKYRILMRREQVFRVCANHYITKEMTLAPNAGSENSLVWQAMDASDGEPQMEELAVRFKLAETTQRFKAVVEECQAELKKQSQDGEVSSTYTKPEEASVDKKEDNDDSKAEEPATPATNEAETTPSETPPSSGNGDTDSKN